MYTLRKTKTALSILDFFSRVFVLCHAGDPVSRACGYGAEQLDRRDQGSSVQQQSSASSIQRAFFHLLLSYQISTVIKGPMHQQYCLYLLFISEKKCSTYRRFGKKHHSVG